MPTKITESTRMKFWTMPSHYFGETWPGYYVCYSQARDSDVVTRSNFQAMIIRLEEADAADAAGDWQIVRESHWALGWVEWIAIHQDCSTLIDAADEALSQLKNYPVLDEELYSQMENEDCEAIWSGMLEKDRLEYLVDKCGREYLPFRETIAASRGDWGHAANLLPDPSDIAY